MSFLRNIFQHLLKEPKVFADQMVFIITPAYSDVPWVYYQLEHDVIRSLSENHNADWHADSARKVIVQHSF